MTLISFCPFRILFVKCLTTFPDSLMCPTEEHFTLSVSSFLPTSPLVCSSPVLQLISCKFLYFCYMLYLAWHGELRNFGVNCLAGQDLCLLPHSFMELLWEVLSVACPSWGTGDMSPSWGQLTWKSVGMIECTDGTEEGNRK